MEGLLKFTNWKMEHYQIDSTHNSKVIQDRNLKLHTMKFLEETL